MTGFPREDQNAQARRHVSIVVATGRMSGLAFEDAARHLVATDPAFAVRAARIRGTDYRVFSNIPGTLPDLLKACRAAHDGGAAVYLCDDDVRWTYDDFCAEVRAIAQALAQRGVSRGDRVAIAMRNYPEYLVLFMAIAARGAVTVFLNAWWTAEELAFALDDSAPDLIFADGPRMERLLRLPNAPQLRLVGVRDGEDIAPERYSDLRRGHAGAGWPDIAIDPEDDYAIMYSSGTTSHPKGVVLTHRGAVNAVQTWMMQAAIASLMQGDPPPEAPAKQVVLVATPLFHITATHPVFLCSLPAGARIVLLRKWDAAAAARLIRSEGVTRFIGVPTQSAELMEYVNDTGKPFDTLQFIASGGAKRPAPQVGPLARTFPNAQIATGWGMTETNAIGIGLAGEDYVARPGVAGRLYPPLQELRFLDEDGRDVPPGEVGEITVKSPCNMRCYLNNPAATEAVLRDGWLRTGDLGRIDAEGYVTIVDRRKNIIIRGGENIACLDVEAALHRHPAVVEACAFAVPDDRLGEVVGAAVLLRDGAGTAPDELRDFLADHIAPFKIPQHVWLRDGPLPRGATDKFDRRGLRRDCLRSLDKGDMTDAGPV